MSFQNSVFVRKMVENLLFHSKTSNQNTFFSLQKYNQEVQDFKLNGYFLVIEGSISKTKIEEKFVFGLLPSP